MSDALVYRLERDIREWTQGLERGTPHAAKTRALLLRKLEQIRPSIRADDAHRIEVLIDKRTT